LLLHSQAPGAAEVSAWVGSGLDILSMAVALAGSSEFVALASTGSIV
jgi:hypothetical protein